MLIYALYRKDVVFTLGQLFYFVVYIRNLFIIKNIKKYRKKKKKKENSFFLEILSNNIFQINLFNNQMKKIRLK